MGRADVAVVVIGRNEGSRLPRCLQSVGRHRTVYVDSGSSDGSPDLARSSGVEVIELDPAAGFTAARGRNAGLERMLADPAIRYVQMLDGDSVLDPGWIARGAASLDADPELGAVLGGLRESRPEASVYAWLCDVEWAAAPGPATAIGGIAMLRADALRAVGLYRPDMIAGEDPELSIRLRAAGWRIHALAAPMGTHDAAITRFGQWWRRTARAGHAFAELVALHPRSPLHDYDRSWRRIWFWGGMVPGVALGGLALAAATGDPRWIALAGGAALLTLAQWLRIGLRDARRHPPARALAFAFFLMLGKYAEMCGLVRFHLGRWKQQRRRER